MSGNQIKNIAVIGAGPIGIAAAAHLIEKGLRPFVLEKGEYAGAAMSQWGHVRLFTPWKYVFDRAVLHLLEQLDWKKPDEEALPTGRDIVEQYLMPAANSPSLKPCITYGVEVVGVAKSGCSKHTSAHREDLPFTLHFKDRAGEVQVMQVDGVIDASGTWSSPNPIGLNGLAVPGELENKANISYGLPDVNQSQQWWGKRNLVIGAGHSAMNIVLDLLNLNGDEGRVFWGLRGNNIDKLLGGGINDELPARGALGARALQAINDGGLFVLNDLQVTRLVEQEQGVRVEYLQAAEFGSVEVDHIFVATGFRPNLDILRELRLDLDNVVEAPGRLAPMIDPNLHSCGTVKPHGVSELSHTDKHFYIVGMKSYGRAPTFLMRTGYEQVRSIVAALAGDYQAAARVELVLPRTGVCSSKSTPSVAPDSCEDKSSGEKYESECC